MTKFESLKDRISDSLEKRACSFVRIIHPTAGVVDDAPVGMLQPEQIKNWLCKEGFSLDFVLECEFKKIDC